MNYTIPAETIYQSCTHSCGTSTFRKSEDGKFYCTKCSASFKQKHHVNEQKQEESA